MRLTNFNSLYCKEVIGTRIRVHLSLKMNFTKRNYSVPNCVRLLDVAATEHRETCSLPSNDMIELHLMLTMASNSSPQRSCKKSQSISPL